MEDHEGIGAKAIQRLCRHLGGHAWMTVTVTSHPGPKPQGGKVRTLIESLWGKPHALPRVPEPAVEIPDYAGQDVAEVVEQVASLIRDGGFLEEDLPGPPEPLQKGTQFGLPGSPVSTPSHLLEKLHEEPVLLEHRRTFRLRGVGGEDRFYLYGTEDLGD